MGYTALLFCPDDKTARTVTQVLSELEFTVEACIEPFAAVKKLMGQHFDAVVVDCDNEQNATLLFKSARNSTPNQTSLAVAVVEGQAGVAKAFRIGANLVLTKPINIEQAKGTLRVARGLLRKSDPAKPATTATPAPASAAPATPAAPAAPAGAKSAVPRPAPAAKVAAPAPRKPATPAGAAAPVVPRATQIPAPKPAATQAWPAAASASSKPAAQDDDLLGIDAPQAPANAASQASNELTAGAASPKPENPLPAAEVRMPAVASSQVMAGSGAASAPAPAREAEGTKVAEKPASGAVDATPEKPAEGASSEPAYAGAAPTFSFGGANSEVKSGGGNKKIFIGVAAAFVLAAAGFFGWTQFKDHRAATPAAPAAVPAAVSTNPQPKPSANATPVVPPLTSATNTPVPTTHTTAAPTNPPADSGTDSDSGDDSTAAPSAHKPANPASPAKTTAEAVEPEPEPAPMIVKGGKAPVAPVEPPAADAPAPSMEGMTTGATPPPDLVTNTSSELRPTLQTLSISQGVSQGLLYKKVAPTYPTNALRMRIEGAVELQATISKTGDITQVRVLSGDPQLTKAAVDAVKQWKYKPYLLNGEPVEIQTQVSVNFKLPH